MPTMQIQARALGDPTRHAIFRYVADADRPVDVAELTAHFGLNHNAIRQHLAKLVDAGLVSEATARPSGRGRPRLQYVVDPSSDSRWGVTGPYERLSMLLAEMLRSGDSAVQVGRRAGRRQRIGGAPTTTPVESFVEQMARQGFEPTARRHGDDLDVVLANCPFSSAVLTDPDTVCELHLGLAQGVAEAVGGGVVVDELVPRDPRRANCRLRCHVAGDAG
jgi:predicted ArsR family transcriptional regulator